MPTDIPVIDFGPFLDGSDPARIACEVDAACRDTGFFVITGHGVDLGLLQRTRQVALDFFRLPADVKEATTKSFTGYSPFRGERLAYSLGDETPPDLKEGYGLGRPETDPSDPYFTHPDALKVFPTNVFPTEPAGFREVSQAYYWRMSDLCDAVLEVFALALGLPRDWFAPHTDKHFSFLRYVYYPALSEAPLPGQLRAGAHSDYGTFTLVNFDDAPGGLQVLGRDGHWVDVPVLGDSFVCNIGDLLEVWTNDRWVSTLHRVTVPPPERWDRSERLSLVYFHEPNWNAVASALPTCVDDEHPARYEPLTAGEHNRRKVERQRTLQVEAS